MKRKVIITLAIASAIAIGFVIQKRCPAYGAAKDEKRKGENSLKNRSRAPKKNEVAPYVTFERMIAPGEDRERFKNNMAATITGYVKNVEREGPESCNCYSNDDKYHDWHITMTPSADKIEGRYRVIVEATPHMGKWEEAFMKSIKGKTITVSGWLFFDDEHDENAYNTNPSGKRIWRATCWEIHPISSIAVVK